MLNYDKLACGQTSTIFARNIAGISMHFSSACSLFQMAMIVARAKEVKCNFISTEISFCLRNTVNLFQNLGVWQEG